MVVDIYDIARTEAMLLGFQHYHHTSLEDLLVGELRSPMRAYIARLRLHTRIREYVHLPAHAVDVALASHWADLELAFACGQTLH